MNLKINYSYIGIAIFTFFFFFWGVDIKENFLNLYSPEHQTSYYLDKKQLNKLQGSYFRLSYLIILLIIPIFYSFLKKGLSSFAQIFNYQRYIIFFTLFIIAHYFFVKVYYNTIIDKSEIANLAYLVLLSVIYCHYRNFIFLNFKKILTVYLIIFVFFSIYEGTQIYNIGQCNNDLFLIQLIQDYLKISLSNSIYIENSHLAMMSIAVFFSCVYILVRSKKINILFLLLFSIGVIIVLNNLSTTYFVCYFFAQITLLLFFLKRINIKFWIVTILLLLINSYLFFSDKQCTVKVTDLKISNVIENRHEIGDINLTTYIYQRSMIVAKNTILHHSFGWGIDGMNNANYNLIKKYEPIPPPFNRTTFWNLQEFNIKDGLSNSLKMFTEFGIFSFIIYFYFIKYIFNIKNISSYNLFIIILFITLSIRSAGYFNGGFIFCLLEFLYYKNFSYKLKFNK